MAVYGGEWPSNNARLEMLEEAITVMNRLWTSDKPISQNGKFYTLRNAVLLTRPKEKVPVYVSAIGPRAADLAGRLGDHLITLANNPPYVREELLPAFEAGARAAGKDPSTMERVGHFSYLYDPDQVIKPEQIQQDAGTIQGGAMAKAFASGVISIFTSAEDFIKKIEEMKGMGYTHIAIGNVSSTLEKASRVPSYEAPSLKIWKEVLPHVR
jgi:alkanesulfonate monooxygenase SsuD/methylene tetrahydromethanopterin reductase-like flavin-dependent oxidoreductase (luciferase family)